MQKIILATINGPAGKPRQTICPQEKINIFTGSGAEAAFWSLANLFYPGASTPLWENSSIQAQLQVNPYYHLYITGIPIGCKLSVSVNHIRQWGQHHAPGEIIKAFHRQRFLSLGRTSGIFDGRSIDSSLIAGESRRLLAKWDTFLQENAAATQPLFVCNFLQRLDESIDTSPIFHAMAKTGRQCFLLLPDYDSVKPPDYAAIFRL